MAPEVSEGFSRLEAKKKNLYVTHAPAHGGPVQKPARAVRLKKGAQPDYSKLTGLQATAWKYFRNKAQQRGVVSPVLEEDLLKAHIRMRGDEFMAYCYFLAYAVGIPLGVVMMVMVGVFLGLLGGLGWIAFLLGAVFIPILPVAIFGAIKAGPSSKAKARGINIDRKISSAMSFVSAMASADVNIDAIFKELAKEKIYGAVAEEAAWITRDTELLGVDILTAIKEGASRTPSKRFQDFLQGVVTTATSGGQLKPYFLLKAEQYEKENKLDVLKGVETMGLMAEVFVTAVVAFPLFLIIMISIFAVVGGQGAQMLLWLAAIVGMIPAFQFVFILIMHSIQQGA